MPATMTYNAAAQFPAAQDAGDDMTHWGVYSAAIGGDFYGPEAGTVSNNPDALAVGERWSVAAGQVVITFGDGGMTAEWAKKKADLMAAETLYLSAHTAAPGITGDNEADYTGYARVALTPASWVTAQT